MKSVARLMPVDDLGRVVIPIDIRRGLGIKEKDRLSVSSQGRQIIFEKPITSCMICGKGKHLHSFQGLLFCDNCINKMLQLLIEKQASKTKNKEIALLNEKIVLKRNELNSAIEQGKPYEVIYQISVELDEMIAEYIRHKEAL